MRWLSFTSLLFTCLSLLCAQAEFLGNLSNVITADRLPLRTQGRFIVDKDGSRAKLACVNWYGAHMELFAIDGLQVRNITEIVARIVGLGFNCVRLVFSLDLYYEDPLIREIGLSANPGYLGINITGMQLLDEVVEELAKQDVLIILNNHNSAAGWCCDLSSEEGIWSNSIYSTDMWIDALGNLTQRYVAYPQVVGFDLRNEIHDYGDRVITWGASDDKDIDWKVATELAGARVLEENPEMLIIVSGLCSGYDIRLLEQNPPVLPVDAKLVWTVHTYSFSTYWGLIQGQLKITSWSSVQSIGLALLITSILALTVLALIAYKLRKSLRVSKNALLLSVACWLGFCSLLSLGAGLLWKEALRQGACSAMNGGAIILIGLSSASLSVSALLFSLSMWRLIHHDPNDAEQKLVAKEYLDTLVPPRSSCPIDCWLVNLAFLFTLVLSFASLIFWFSGHAETYDILRNELSEKWVLDNPKNEHPIWVGEFGNSQSDKWWKDVIRFLSEKDLDFGYWALNGLRWDEYGENWGPEGYGILGENYFDVKLGEMVEEMQTIQKPTTP